MGYNAAIKSTESVTNAEVRLPEYMEVNSIDTLKESCTMKPNITYKFPKDG